MKKIKLGLAIFTLSVTSLSLCSCNGFYTGAQVGVTNLHQTTRTVCTGEALIPPGIVSVPVEPTSNSYGGRLYLGGNINRYSALEMGVANYGYVSYQLPSGHLVPPCGTPTFKLQALDIVAKVGLPFSSLLCNTGCNGGNMNSGAQGFNIFGKFGAAYVTTSLSGSLNSPCSSITGICSGSASTNGVRPIVGLGVEYGFNQNLAADLTYSKIISGGGNIPAAEMIALGFSYHFTERYCGQFLCDD